MSWSDPCSNCGHHRADCECGRKIIEESYVIKTEELSVKDIIDRYGKFFTKKDIKNLKKIAKL